VAPATVCALVIGAVAVAATGYASGQSTSAPLAVTAPSERADLADFDRRLTAFFDDLGKCAQGQRERAAGCICAARAQRQDLDAAFAALLRRHPQWKDATVSYAPTPAAPAPVILSLPVVSRQLESWRVVKC
jgi:hypothetical protein